MELFEWIEHSLSPRECNSVEFIYEEAESQSGKSLPVIYQPFDAKKRSHWRDRGSLFDFLCSIQGEGKRLLDFGPGDGWPSLIVAPYAAEVIGVDGAEKRVAVCTGNAERLGIANARFILSGPGEPLPFEDETFDGVMAASSIEQTPEPVETLRELHRVLRSGGCIRIDYESLDGYRNGRERDFWLWGIDENRCMLILFDRDIENERVRQYGLSYPVSAKVLASLLSPDGLPLSFDRISVYRLEALNSSLVETRVCTTIHPSGKTLADWLNDIGFREILPTHSGAEAAGMLFDEVPDNGRPMDMRDVDSLVAPLVRIVTRLAAPLDGNPLITAVK